MADKRMLFLRVLRAELEDCIEDLEDLAILYDRRHRSEAITNYVFNENEALLARELRGIKMLILSIDDITMGSYDSLEAFAQQIDTLLQNKVLEFEDPQAVYGIAKRKLLKVISYLETVSR